ncbi:hypothetical protein PENSPDRAFT_694582 [Peniophora sp. CONT]|nr:hypothetical protein PENSPDRAFT_694582 [Peniophora sp. CONT]
MTDRYRLVCDIYQAGTTTRSQLDTTTILVLLANGHIPSDTNWQALCYRLGHNTAIGDDFASVTSILTSFKGTVSERAFGVYLTMFSNLRTISGQVTRVIGAMGATVDTLPDEVVQSAIGLVALLSLHQCVLGRDPNHVTLPMNRDCVRALLDALMLCCEARPIGDETIAVALADVTVQLIKVTEPASRDGQLMFRRYLSANVNFQVAADAVLDTIVSGHSVKIPEWPTLANLCYPARLDYKQLHTASFYLGQSGPAKTLTRAQARLLETVKNGITMNMHPKREPFLNDIIREVWCLVNPQYNWSHSGKPGTDASYLWTKEKVYDFFALNGARRDAYVMENKRMSELWTGESVFNELNQDAIRQHIWTKYPHSKDNARCGTLPYWQAANEHLYKQLTEGERREYEDAASRWSISGANMEVRQRRWEAEGTAFLKAMATQLYTRFGKWGAFIIIGEEDKEVEVELKDYFKPLGLASRPMKKWAKWKPLLARAKEYYEEMRDELERGVMPAGPAPVAAVIKTRRKLDVSEKTDIVLELDRENMKVIMPVQRYETDRASFIRQEKPFVRELLEAGFRVAQGMPDLSTVHVPWKELGAHPERYLDPKYIPKDCAFTEPSHMLVSNRLAFVDRLMILGSFAVLHQPTGHAGDTIQSSPRITVTRQAAPAPTPLETVVNRYGSRGREILLASGDLRLYDINEVVDTMSTHVIEDTFGDPDDDVLATTGDYHSPCSVPSTSEGRGQYMLTMLQAVANSRDRTTLTEAVRCLVLLPFSPADANTLSQIAAHAAHTKSPSFVTWEAESPLVADKDILVLEAWLASSPYRADSKFLGWAQGWQFALGLLLFLVTESSRQVNSWQLAASPEWDSLADRHQITAVIVGFNDQLDLLLRKNTWPGISPANKYRFAYSRSGYLTRLNRTKDWSHLVHLVSFLPEGQSDCATQPRRFGHWDYGRCGLPTEYHKSSNEWATLASEWCDGQLFIRSGELCTRESAMTWLLKIGLAWADCEHLAQGTDLDGWLAASQLPHQAARTDINRGIRIHIRALEHALSNIEITEPTSACLPLFDDVLPDLQSSMTETIMRLRLDEPLTAVDRAVQRKLLVQHQFATQLERNRAARKAYLAENPRTAPPVTLGQRSHHKQRMLPIPERLPPLPSGPPTRIPSGASDSSGLTTLPATTALAKVTSIATSAQATGAVETGGTAEPELPSPPPGQPGSEPDAPPKRGPGRPRKTVQPVAAAGAGMVTRKRSAEEEQSAARPKRSRKTTRT